MQRSWFLVLVVIAVASPFCISQNSGPAITTPDPFKSTLDRLGSLLVYPSGEWRSHDDIPHPEDMSLNDSDWDRISVASSVPSGNWAGARVFRSSIEVPLSIHGYATEGSTVKLDLGFVSEGILLPGSLQITVFSNGSILYRGGDDNLQPLLLTENAQAGQRFLVSVRVEAPDNIRSRISKSELMIAPADSRPSPALLRMEILSARSIVGAYPEGREGRERTLTSALREIDFSPLDRGDQAGFDASLRRSQAALEPLRSWLQQFSVLAVGNTHIDLAWLWSWTESVEIVRNNFQSVLDLMREYPDFKFAMPSAQAYEWMQDKYPDLFKQVQQRVAEGRWEVVGGMWVEPDLNMPAGESLVRQILIGKQYFKKNLGVDVKVGWNPDSFGYNWQLPQIYKKSGIDYFITPKLLWAHDFTEFPYKLFWWQSPDGSKILTYFPHHYGGNLDGEAIANDVSVWMPSMYGQDTGNNPEMMHLYGVGDHGGGPTRTMLDQGLQLSSPSTVFPRLKFAFAGDFFADIEKKLPGLKVPTWNSELYLQSHRGTLTTQAETKRRIRYAEESVLDAEVFASFATLYGQPYPIDDLRLAWKSLLFDQFHDLMPGSGVALNYVEAKLNLENVDRTAGDVTDSSLRQLAAHAETRGPGVPVIVFNPLSWPRTEVIETEVQFPSRALHLQVVDGAGRAVASQLLQVDGETGRARLLVLAHLPAFGYETYFVRAAVSAAGVRPLLKATPSSLENEFLRLTIDPASGCMTSLMVKSSHREILAPAETDSGGPRDRVCGNLLQAFEDKPRLDRTWNLDAWNIDWDFEKTHWDIDRADSVKVIESGPLRAVIRITNHFQNSTFSRDITMYAGVPRVDIKMSAEWHEKHILLKVAFPLNVHNERAAFEIPFGSIDRPTTRNTLDEQAQFEVPAQRWADLSDAVRGFSLLNDCKYGYDAKGNVLRLSLLRSPDFPDPHADEGHHEFIYSLYPHDGTWQQAQTIRRGYELNNRPIAWQTASHEGYLGHTHSFVSVDADNVIVTAIKKAEDDDALVLRFFEWAGIETNVRLHVPPGVKSAEETDLMERSVGKLPLQDQTIVIHAKPFEIKTLKAYWH